MLHIFAAPHLYVMCLLASCSNIQKNLNCNHEGFEMNKRAVLIAISILQIALLSGCSEKDWVGDLKSSVLQEYDKVKPVGEAFDKWENCQGTEWNILKKDENYTEIQYECDLKGVDKIISNLKANQQRIQENSVMRSRELEETIKLKRAGAEMYSCQMEVFIENLDNGSIKKSIDSLYTDRELNEKVKYFYSIFSEALDKSKNNSFKDKKELTEYMDKMEGVWDPIKYQFNSLEGKKSANECKKSVEASLADKKDWIYELSLPDRFSYAGVILYDVFNEQAELDSYKINKDFDGLKKIKIVVIFGANKDTFEVKQIYSEFLIGAESKQVLYQNNTMIKAVYNNEIYTDSLIKNDDIVDMVKLF